MTTEINKICNISLGCAPFSTADAHWTLTDEFQSIFVHCLDKVGTITEI